MNNQSTNSQQKQAPESDHVKLSEAQMRQAHDLGVAVPAYLLA